MRSYTTQASTLHEAVCGFIAYYASFKQDLEFIIRFTQLPNSPIICL